MKAKLSEDDMRTTSLKEMSEDFSKPHLSPMFFREIDLDDHYCAVIVLGETQKEADDRAVQIVDALAVSDAQTSVVRGKSPPSVALRINRGENRGRKERKHMPKLKHRRDGALRAIVQVSVDLDLAVWLNEQATAHGSNVSNFVRGILLAARLSNGRKKRT